MESFIVVWDLDGTCYHAQMQYRERLAEAVVDYLETGRDCLIQMLAVSGDVFVLRASQVHSWQVSTPEGREQQQRVMLALATEEAEIKASLGIWDDE